MSRARGLLVAALGVFRAAPAAACPPPAQEICDGEDNDGDGLVDEDGNPDAGEPPLCPDPADVCAVAPGARAQCAIYPGGEFVCPAGYDDLSGGVRSGTGEPLSPDRCFSSNECGGCRGERCDDQGRPVCGPEPLPPCVCHPGGRCLNACAGITCPSGWACRDRPPGSGTCQPNGDCRIAGGCAPGELCFDGACLPDPCDPNPCEPGWVCRGSATGASCERASSPPDADVAVDASAGPDAAPDVSVPPEAAPGSPGVILKPVGSGSGGCSCAVPGRRRNAPAAALALLALSACASRRRGRRATR